MITHDLAMHAASIAAINQKNDQADFNRHGWRMLGFSDSKYNRAYRLDLRGEARAEYDRGYKAGKIAFEYTETIACR